MVGGSRKTKESCPSKAMFTMSEEGIRFKTRQATEEVRRKVQSIH